MRFNLRIDGGPERYYEVKTGVYRDAAASVPANTGTRPPMIVEIWHESLHPQENSFFYLIKENEYGALLIEHVMPRSGSNPIADSKVI